MTNQELDQYSKRIDEISITLDLCDEKWDSDVIDNLTNELEEIEAILEVDLEKANRRSKK